MAPKYNVEGGIKDGVNWAEQPEIRLEPEPNHLETKGLDYVVEETVEPTRGSLDTKDGYFIQGVSEALEADGKNRADIFTQIGIQKLGGGEKLTSDVVEEVEDFSQNAIAYAIEQMDDAYKEAQEYGEDPLKFAAIQGSLAQGTCVHPQRRESVSEVGPVDVDLFVVGETYIPAEGDEDWRNTDNRKLNDLENDANTRMVIEELEKQTDFYTGVHTDEKHNARAAMVAEGQGFPPYKLPIHPIGVTKGNVMEEGGFNDERRFEDYMMNPSDLGEENQTHKYFGDFVVNMWEGVFVPEQYADPEMVQEIDYAIDQYTTDEGKLIEEDLRAAKVKDSTLDYVEDKYGENVIV